MKKLGALGMVLICTLFFVACSGSGTTAIFKDVQLSAEIDESTYEPITVTSEFYTDTSMVYVTGIVDKAPEGTLAGADCFYVEDGQDLFIDGADVELDEAETAVYFSFPKPAEGWSLGDYEVNMYLDKEVVLTLSFKVIEYSEEANTASLRDLQVASAVDEETYEPTTVTDTFNTKSPIVYMTGTVDNVTPGQVIRAEWFYSEEDGDTFMDEASVELVDEISAILFSYDKPEDGWPTGEYMIDIYIDDSYMETLDFTVE